MIDSEKDFIYMKINQTMIWRAQKRAKDLGRLKNSITEGEGNYAGFLGELAVKEYIRGTYSTDVERYNHDIICYGKTIEVKTKRRTAPPKLEYEVSIASTSKFQIPDYYVFTSVDGEFVWLLGFISHDEYFHEAKYIKNGDIDISNGFVCRRDMHNLKHKYLYPMKEFSHVLSSTMP